MDKHPSTYSYLITKRLSSFVVIVSTLIFAVISAIFFSPVSKAEIYNVFKTKETDVYVNGDTCNYWSSSQCYTRMTLIGPDGNYYTAGGDGTNTNTYALNKISSDGTFLGVLQIPTVQGFGFGHNGNIYTNDSLVNGSHGGQKSYLVEYDTNGTLVATHDLFPAEDGSSYNCTLTPDYNYSLISSSIVMGQDSLMYVPVARIYPCDTTQNFDFLMAFSSGLVLDHTVTIPSNPYNLGYAAYDVDASGNIYAYYLNTTYKVDKINSSGAVTSTYSLISPTSCST